MFSIIIYMYSTIEKYILESAHTYTQMLLKITYIKEYMRPEKDAAWYICEFSGSFSQEF